jgi:hypothetical protein
MRFDPVRFLLAVALLLAGWLAWNWFDEQAQLRPLAWVPPKPLVPDLKFMTKDLQPGASLVGGGPYTIILARPMFAPDRRPPPPPAPPPPPDPMASVQVRGIFSGENAGILASVDGKMRRIKINESIGSWTLKSINGRVISFAQGDTKRELSLAYAPLGVRSPTVNATTPGQPLASTPQAASAFRTINPQDEAREYQRRRNEALAARGLPTAP